MYRTGSITTTRRWLRTLLRTTLPTRNSITRWREQFLTAENMAHRGGNGRPRKSDGEIEKVWSLFENNPRLNIRQTESLLNMPRSTLQRVLRKDWVLYPYKMKAIHGITRTDKRKRIVFVRHYQNQHEGMSENLLEIAFSERAFSAFTGLLTHKM